MGLQYVIVTYGGAFTQTVPLRPDQWARTTLLGFCTLPLGVLMRMVPVHEPEASFAPWPRGGAPAAKAVEAAEASGGASVLEWLRASLCAGVVALVPVVAILVSHFGPPTFMLSE